MFPDLWEFARYIRSWIMDIWDKVDLRLASRSWQTAEATNITAMMEEADRPDGKPRPRKR